MMTKEDMEDASGEGEQECWFGEGGCLKSSNRESGSWREWSESWSVQVNLATPIYGDKPGLKNWMMMMRGYNKLNARIKQKPL